MQHKLLLVVPWCILLLAAADTPDQRDAERESLSRLQNFVGQWRGVGQPRRGSKKDNWIEECGWAWKFTGEDVSLKLESGNGKYLRGAELRPSATAGQYELTATTPDGAAIHYRGTLAPDGSLPLVSERDPGEAPARITIRLIAGGDRMLVLYERKAGTDRYTRLAEVGFTRQGSSFGKGTSYIECVVTGGTGTIPVTYEGKTYYVCCTGCRDYLNDHPSEVLAEYKAKKEAEKQKVR